MAQTNLITLSLATLSLASSAMALEPFSFERSGGSTVCGYLTKPENVDSFPILIFLQGGEDTCIREFHLEIEPLAQEWGIGLMTLEKWGNESGDDEAQDWETYYRRNTVEQRYCDHAHLMDLLREGLVPEWDRRVVWMGGSEGASLAAYLAPVFLETSALMIYSGGSAWSYHEEGTAKAAKYFEEHTDLISLCGLSHPLAQIAGDFFWYYTLASAGDEDREDFQKQRERGRMPTRHYLSCARMPALTRFVAATPCPVLCVHGTEDEIVPIEASDAMVEELQAMGRPNLTYWRMEGADHCGVYDDPYFGIQKGFEWLGKELR